VLISWSGKVSEFSSTGFSCLDCTYYPKPSFLYAQLFSKSEKLDVLMREMVMQPVAFDYDVSELKVFIDAFFNRTKIE